MISYLFRIGFYVFIISMPACGIQNNTSVQPTKKQAFVWENANIYFLMTDRFYNGDTSNDFEHPVKAATLRGYMGGDIQGITYKIKEGYFDSLGVTAIWMTPLVENIAEGVDEGTGMSYGFHGYWTRDWTAIDPRKGTKADIKEMVSEAHKRGIRIILDVVINHTGPFTLSDTKWPDEWVRTGPQCTYKGYQTTIECTLVKNLPDIRTESTEEVSIPDFLAEKWKKEGRYDSEMAGLDAFFERTKYPRRPYYYIVKWLTDMIREYGIDGFRVDTVKHVEEEVWTVLEVEAQIAYEAWKSDNPDAILKNDEFYMVGEVYNYNANNGRIYDFGDKKVDYFDFGFKSLINFGFKYDAQQDYPDLFSKYDSLLTGPLAGKSTVHYLSSHDDGSPFDPTRQRSIEAATKMLLSPGAVQIYYGDESSRRLDVEARGDARLRSFMNWDQMAHPDTLEILRHWQKLGQFRKNHPAIGAGKHHEIQKSPFVFSRVWNDDQVVCAINVQKGTKSIPVNGIYSEGTMLKDFYSGKSAKVENGSVVLDTEYDLVLLEKME